VTIPVQNRRLYNDDRLRVGTDPESYIPRGEKMLYSGTDPESYITEYTLVYEDTLAKVDGYGTHKSSFAAEMTKH